LAQISANLSLLLGWKTLKTLIVLQIALLFLRRHLSQILPHSGRLSS
jgi:hypothetical protein